MKKTVLILGGARSGKSRLAVELAGKLKKQVVFIATCEPLDREMKDRVKRHRQNRPEKWQTIEETFNIIPVLEKIAPDKTVILDCITLWVSNMLMKGMNEKEILEKIDEFVKTLGKIKSTVIIVLNEVGWGIVPENRLARLFRDIVGSAHQKISSASDEVYLTVAGIPLKIKGGKIVKRQN